jgi:hypothetical protein
VGGPAGRRHEARLRNRDPSAAQDRQGPHHGPRLCANDPNHPNNIFIDAIKPNGDVCRVCGGALKSRSDDQDEDAINKRHDIYYYTNTGTLAAAYFYKDLAAKGATKYIELNGEGSIDSIKETLLAKLA